jgi:ATP-dependent Clp protease ATP-binding subunit ClpC
VAATPQAFAGAGAMAQPVRPRTRLGHLPGMNGPLVVFTSILFAAAIAFVVARRVARPTASDGAEAPPPPPEPIADPLRMRVYAIENAVMQTPEVTTPGDLMLNRPFMALVEHFSQPAFDNAALESYVTGNRTVPAWAALIALARRPADPAIAKKALFWMNQVTPWTRFHVLRLLEAWAPEDPHLAGRVLVRVERDWLNSGAHLMLLDEFLRRRAAIGPIVFDDDILDELTDEDLERLALVLSACEPELVAPIRAQLKLVEDMRTANAPEAPSSPARPLPSDPDVAAAGARHEPGKFPAPVVYPRAAMSAAIEDLEHVIGSEARRSVLITGEPGVGKTTLVRRLASSLSRQGWTVFETHPSVLNAGMSFTGQLEGRMQALLRELRRNPKTVWVVRDFHMLAWAGRHTGSDTGILDILKPVLESGELLVIGETRPAAGEQMLSRHPDLVRSLESVRLDAPQDDEMPGIVRAWRGTLPEPRRRMLADALIDEAVLLARHHLGVLGSPSGVLRLLERALEAAARDGDAPAVTSDHVLRALARLTGLPADLLDDRMPLDVTDVRDFFAMRVIGQPEAVHCLVDRLALMKAGVTSPRRPYGVFLFAGPSGTGKTELVKTLATYLFGAPDRMVRVDMSELQDAGAMDRMLSADGLAAGGSLASRVRRQPFSVVLLDEFEKAHPRIWDLFLQVFDDGRLTDSRGETVDFRNTIIVLTSNLGAKLKGNERLGFVAGHGFDAGAVERAIATTFRPEFLNRLDRTVVFRPLSRDAMRDILRLQIAEAFRRRGLRRRDWAVEIEESALEFLLERGFTVDLGARPLQRSLDQYLLTPLARALVEHRAPEGDQFLFVRADGDRLAVEFVDPDAPAGPPMMAGAPPVPAGTQDVRAIAWDAQGDAREFATLRDATVAIEEVLAGATWTERKAALLGASAQPGFWERDDRFEVFGRAEFMDRVESGARSARSLLTRLEGEARARAAFPRPMLKRLAQQLVLLGTASQEALDGGPRDAFVAIEPGPDAGAPDAMIAWRDRLAAMYECWARARGMRVQSLDPPRSTGPRGAGSHWYAVSGFASFTTLQPEDGLHVLEDGRAVPGSARVSARVRVALQPSRPPRGDGGAAQQAAEAFAATSASAQVVRRYRELPSPLVRDAVRGWRTGRAERVWAGDFDLVPVDGSAGEG